MIRPIDQIPEGFFIVLPPEDLSPSHPPPIRPSLPRRLAHPVQLEPGSGGTMDDRGDIVLENHEETAIDSIIIRVNDDNDDGGQVGQKDNRDEVISPDDNDIATIKLKQFQLNENIDDDNPSSLELSVVPDNALRLYIKTGESSYEVLTPQDYVIENIEQLAGEKLGDVLSGPVTLYAEALDVLAGQLPPEVTIKWVYRPTSYYTIDYGASDQLKIQVRWAVYPKFALFYPVSYMLEKAGTDYANQATNDIQVDSYDNGDDNPGDSSRMVDIPFLVNKITGGDLGLLFIHCHGHDPSSPYPYYQEPLILFESYTTSQQAMNMHAYYIDQLGIHGVWTQFYENISYVGINPLFFDDHIYIADRNLVHLGVCCSNYPGNTLPGIAEYIADQGPVQSAIGYNDVVSLGEMNFDANWLCTTLDGKHTIGEVYNQFLQDGLTDYIYSDETAPYSVLGTKPLGVKK